MELEDISFDNICLVCVNSRNAIEISASPDSETPKYLDLIKILGEVDITEELDEIDFPKKICYKCALELINFYKFKLQIKNSYEELKYLILSRKIEKKTNTAKYVMPQLEETDGLLSLDFIEDKFNSSKDICEYLHIEEYNKDIDADEVEIYSDDLTNYTANIINDLKTDHKVEVISEVNNVDESNIINETNEIEEMNDLDEREEMTDTDEMKCDLNDLDISNDNIDNYKHRRKLSNELNEKELSKDELDAWQRKLGTWIKKQGKKEQVKCRFACEICGKDYSSKFALKNHFYVHTGELNYECDDCGRKFGQKSLLYAHVKVKHSVTTLYTCDKCGRGFNKKCNLSRHRWVHLDQLRYSCEFCGEAFKWKSCLHNHLNIHNGIGFGCELCNKKFVTEAATKKHCRIYHNGEGMECTVETKVE